MQLNANSLFSGQDVVKREERVKKLKTDGRKQREKSSV